MPMSAPQILETLGAQNNDLNIRRGLTRFTAKALANCLVYVLELLDIHDEPSRRSIDHE